MRGKRTRRRCRKKPSTRYQRGGNTEFKYYIAANIKDTKVLEDIRSLLLTEYAEYKKEPFRYDDIHITMSYGPIIKANTEPTLEQLLPSIATLKPAKHIDDVVIKGVSLFLRPDRIIVKAEIESAGLTKLKRQLEETYESIGTIASSMRNDILQEEKLLAKKYPKLYTPYDPAKWGHITLIALKPDTDISIVNDILKRAQELVKEIPTQLDCQYLYMVSKKTNRYYTLFNI